MSATDNLRQNLADLTRVMRQSQVRRFDQGKPPGQRREQTHTGEVFPSDSQRGCASKLGGQIWEDR